MSEQSTVAPAEAKKLIDEGAQLIDIRTDHEWEAGRLAGASHIEIASLPERVGEIDRDRPVLIYCRTDNRSTMAAAALAAEGFDVTYVSGGIEAWVEAGEAIEPEGGYVAESGEAAAILQARKAR